MATDLKQLVPQTATVEAYEPFIGKEAVERILAKAKALRGLHVVHINSTFYGGGVAELLDALTMLMNGAGIETGWRVIQGGPDFFSVTKKMHNALQGSEINLSHKKKEIFEEFAAKNAVRNHLSAHDIVVVHDPQPLPLIRHYDRTGRWIWQCHVDMSQPNPQLWGYLREFVEDYDCAIFSLDAYRQELGIPQRFITPAIDPFSITNKELTDADVMERLRHYDIPTDLPIVTQIGRFDRCKDPEGVIAAFEIARREIDATLVLLGEMATDDPEGQEVYDELMRHTDERIIVLSREDTALVNALQRRAHVVLQKSLREGFGLTVSEAMWKGAAVIGGDATGIRAQIENGANGFVVSSVEEAAARIVELVRNEGLRRRLGEAGRKTVSDRFLLVRMLENYLDLFAELQG